MTLTRRRIKSAPDRSARAVRRLYLADPEHAERLPGTGFQVGSIVRLKNIGGEYIVMGERTFDLPVGDPYITVDLWGGKAQNTSFRNVFFLAVRGVVRKPHEKFSTLEE